MTKTPEQDSHSPEFGIRQVSDGNKEVLLRRRKCCSRSRERAEEAIDKTDFRTAGVICTEASGKLNKHHE